MCKTTTPPRPAAQDALRKLPPNTAAGAVIPLQKYLDKAVADYAAQLLPPAGFVYPATVKSKNVAFSLMPLRKSGLNPFYAGVFDDDMDFSASLLKVAALFAAGQFHAEATAFATGYTVWTNFLTDFNAALKARIAVTADSQIISKNFFINPKTATILKASAFPPVSFADDFEKKLALMIVQSDDEASAVCIRAIGYGYISTALKEAGFFDSSTQIGIWLAGTYHLATKNSPSDPYVRIPCDNDNPDAQITTSRLMCKLMAGIRLGQLPQGDSDANTKMQGWLNEPKSGPNHTGPWLGPGRGNTVLRQFTVLQDKIGFAGLGPPPSFPNVYSEGLIINWTGTRADDTPQIDFFNSMIDPTNADTSTHLSGEIAVCWQNLLADQLSPSNFDGIIEVINNSISDFLDQAAI